MRGMRRCREEEAREKKENMKVKLERRCVSGEEEEVQWWCREEDKVREVGGTKEKSRRSRKEVRKKYNK